MANFFLSPIATVVQYMSDSGVILSGGKINTYLAGTTNATNTFTDSTGAVENANPIILNEFGRLQNVSIWQEGGVPIKVVITDANNNPIVVIDQLSGINDTSGLGLIITDEDVQNIVDAAITAQVPPMITNAINSTVTAAFIGGIVFPQTTAEITAGVIPKNFLYQQGNVLRYGADPTGVNDSAPAIQQAIDVLNNWQTYSTALGNSSSPGPDFSQGGDVVIPGGLYTITKTILLAPNIRLRGACPVREVNTNYTTSASNQLVTILRASGSSFPINQFMIDTGIYRLKEESTGNALAPYRVVSASDQFIRGNDKDNGYCNFMINMTVQDMQLDCNNVCAGGLRYQGGAFSYVDGVSVINPNYVCFAFICMFEHAIGRITGIGPVPLMITANESCMQDGGECQLYAVASSQWVTGNQGTINSVVYPFNDPTGGWYNLTLKVIVIQWSINVTLGYLSANLGNVGIELYHSNCNILHWENEFTSSGALFLMRTAKCVCDGLTTKSSGALATGDGTSRLVVREPAFIGCPTSFTPLNGETTSAFEVQVHNYNFLSGDFILGSVTNLSTVNISRMMPNPGPVTLYVDNAGSTSVAGLMQSQPTTIDGALTFIINNPHINKWTLNIAPGENHTISGVYTLQDIDVIFAKATGAAPTIILGNSLTLVNTNIEFAFLGVQSNQTQFFFVEGVVNIEIRQAMFTIGGSRVIFTPNSGTTAKVVAGGFFPSFAFGSSSGLCSGGTNGFINYEDSFASPSTASGTAALEAITTNKVKKIASNLLP